jgi:hypothetical protein
MVSLLCSTSAPTGVIAAAPLTSFAALNALAAESPQILVAWVHVI